MKDATHQAARPDPGDGDIPASGAPAPEAGTPDTSDGKDELKALPLAEVEKRLDSSPEGLSQAEAAKRLVQYGPNEIEEKKQNPLPKLLTYFWGPIPWMIEAAVILSAVAQHWPDFFIILMLLVSNAGVGFWEEHQAGNAIDALKAKLAIKARLGRDEMGSGSPRRRATWCPATSYASGWATSCPPTRGCSMATRSRSISPP